MQRILLHKIISERTAAAPADVFSDTDEPGERAVAQPEVVTVTQEKRVNAELIRDYGPRRGERHHQPDAPVPPGTRLTFSDGGGYVVTESPEEVDALIDALATNGRRRH